MHFLLDVLNMMRPHGKLRGGGTQNMNDDFMNRKYKSINLITMATAWNINKGYGLRKS